MTLYENLKTLHELSLMKQNWFSPNEGTWGDEDEDEGDGGTYKEAPELVDALGKLLVWCIEEGWVR